MRISDLLNPAAIAANMKSTSKNDVLTELADALLRAEGRLDRDEVIHVLQDRERLGSTGIGEGVAIPHGKLKNIDTLMISFGRSRDGVDFDSMDGRPAHLFFLLIAPEESVGVHLKMLARISKLLKSPVVRQRLIESPGNELCRIIAEEEEKI
jgi:PTS system nitrogen regulatory IIA component